MCIRDSIYTDGSKIDENVGAGFIFYLRGRASTTGSYKLHKSNTVFQAELMAIKQAALTLSTLEGFKFVRFYVDSQAALMALDVTWYKSQLVKETFDALNRACEGRKIILNWIKAHVGIEGNEKADELAKQGGVDGIAAIPPFCLLYTSPSPRD